MMLMAGAAVLVAFLGIDPAETGDARELEEITRMLKTAGYETGEARTGAIIGSGRRRGG